MSDEKQVTPDLSREMAPKTSDDKSYSEVELENGPIDDGLSIEHREFLIKRHGTVDLMPLPSASPNDPLNWPTWQVSLATYFIFTGTDLIVKENHMFGTCIISCHDYHFYCRRVSLDFLKLVNQFELTYSLFLA